MQDIGMLQTSFAGIPLLREPTLACQVHNYPALKGSSSPSNVEVFWGLSAPVELPRPTRVPGRHSRGQVSGALPGARVHPPAAYGRVRRPDSKGFPMGP